MTPYQWERSLKRAAERRAIPHAIDVCRYVYPSQSAPAQMAKGHGCEYVVKSVWCELQDYSSRVLVNDRIVGLLANRLRFPVPSVTLVHVDQSVKDMYPDLLHHIRPGYGHGSKWVDCTPRNNTLKHANIPENRIRYAQLAVLWGWMYAGDDFQYFYTNRTNSSLPNLVLSIDHGNFFPGGPKWTAESLTQCDRAEPDGRIMLDAQVTQQELTSAIMNLDEISDNQIAWAVAGPPDEWQFTLPDRVAMCEYLSRRRVELLSTVQASAQGIRL
jgi:hypothetical protein